MLAKLKRHAQWEGEQSKKVAGLSGRRKAKSAAACAKMGSIRQMQISAELVPIPDASGCVPDASGF